MEGKLQHGHTKPLRLQGQPKDVNMQSTKALLSEKERRGAFLGEKESPVRLLNTQMPNWYLQAALGAPQGVGCTPWRPWVAAALPV